MLRSNYLEYNSIIRCSAISKSRSSRWNARVTLAEAASLKFVYGVLEKQFYHYYELATKEEGIAGENLIRLLDIGLSTDAE